MVGGGGGVGSGGWGVVLKVIFMSNPTIVLRLCCVVVGVVTTTVFTPKSSKIHENKNLKYVFTSSILDFAIDSSINVRVHVKTR